MKSASGFSLIEVLVAVIIFSIGLLGAAMLATSSVKNGHNSYLRSQASLLADSLAERMRANPRAIWDKQYKGTFDATKPSLPTCGTGAGKAGCAPADVAQRDLSVMGSIIAAQLPSGSGTVTCTLNSSLDTTYGVAPVDGGCTITISWAEQRDVDNIGYGGTQSFDLLVQP